MSLITFASHRQAYQPHRIDASFMINGTVSSAANAGEAMRGLFMMIFVCLSVGASAPARALQADDTMKAWKQASPNERAALLDRLMGKTAGHAQYDQVLKCLNETSRIPGHTDLPVDQVLDACRKSGDFGQPV